MRMGLNPLKLALTSFGTGDPMETSSMQDIDTLIWSMSIIRFHERSYSVDTPNYKYHWPDITLRATECALYYCVKTMQPRVTGNVIHGNAIEATDAVRDPDSWTIGTPGGLESIYAPENIPPENGTATLEYDKLYSWVTRSNLELHSAFSGQFEQVQIPTHFCRSLVAQPVLPRAIIHEFDWGRQRHCCDCREAV